MILVLIFLLLSQQPETGTVYFYRVEEANRFDSRKPEVKIDGKPLLKMPESEFIGFKLSPGKYGLRMRQKQSEMLLAVEAGGVYYVRVSQTVAGFGFNQTLTLISPDQAIYQMRDMKVLQDKNIKAKDLEAVRVKSSP